MFNHQPVRSQEQWTNQKAGYKKKQPITTMIITDFSYINTWLIPSSFFPNNYDVLLREMRQGIYREEKPDQASKEPSAVKEAYTCDVCGKDFDREDARNRHLKTHTKDPTASGQTYSCVVCGKEFSRADTRKRHEAAHRYSLTCGVCGQYFNRLDILTRHRAQHEKPEAKQRPPMKRRDQYHLNQDPWRSSDVPCYHHHQRLTELQPTRRFYLTILRPETCIDNIGSPSVQRKHPATVSKNGTTLPCMRWQRPPFQRWYGTCTDSRPQPSKSTCLLVLSFGTLRLECCGITFLARRTPDFLMFNTSSEQKKTWRGLSRHDILEYIRQQRPDTKWVVHLLTNVTFYLNKLIQHPIGTRVVLPDFFMRNQAWCVLLVEPMDLIRTTYASSAVHRELQMSKP